MCKQRMCIILSDSAVMFSGSSVNSTCSKPVVHNPGVTSSYLRVAERLWKI